MPASPHCAAECCRSKLGWSVCARLDGGGVGWGGGGWVAGGYSPACWQTATCPTAAPPSSPSKSQTRAVESPELRKGQGARLGLVSAPQQEWVERTPRPPARRSCNPAWWSPAAPCSLWLQLPRPTGAGRAHAQHAEHTACTAAHLEASRLAVGHQATEYTSSLCPSSRRSEDAGSSRGPADVAA